MSFYTEKNGLAQFWNRDHTRLEWAKWVYHHPEQTEKLVEYLLQSQQSQVDLAALIERLDRNDAFDLVQEQEIQNLVVPSTEAISIPVLRHLLESLNQGGN